MKEILFSVHKKHFVVSAREIENSVSFLCLCIENSVSFFFRDNKVFLVHQTCSGNSSDACCNGGQLSGKEGVWC